MCISLKNCIPKYIITNVPSLTFKLERQNQLHCRKVSGSEKMSSKNEQNLSFKLEFANRGKKKFKPTL